MVDIKKKKGCQIQEKIAFYEKAFLKMHAILVNREIDNYLLYGDFVVASRICSKFKTENSPLKD